MIFANTLTGVFDTVTGHILGDGTALAVLYDTAGNDVDFQRVLFGDGNLDGFISQADLDLVLLNWGNSNLNGTNDGVSWVTGDYNGDGIIAQADLDAVLLNWGVGTPPAPGNLAAIPEPGTAAMVGLVCVVWAGRRRTR